MNANTPERRKMSAHTPGPWHVNAVDSKRGRITGDETSTGWDKLQINGSNNTVATVYRPKDARLIAAAPMMLALLEHVPHVLPAVHKMVEHVAGCPGCEARAILRDVEGGK
jgi:hypothetical protein